MFVWKLAFETVVIPLLVGGILWFLVDRVFRFKEGTGSAGAIFLGVGYLTGHVLAVGPPALPPVGTTEWLAWLVVLVALFSQLRVYRESRHLVLPAVLLAVLLGFTLKPMFQYHWELGTGLLRAAVLFLGLLFLWQSLAVLSGRKGSGQLLSLTLAFSGVLVSVVVGLSATTLLAQLAGTAAACMGVLFLLTLFGSRSVQGWLSVALVILTGLVLTGHFYAQLTGWNATGLLAALLVPWVGQLPWIKSRPAWLRAAIVVVAVLLVTAPALITSGQAFLDGPSLDDY